MGRADRNTGLAYPCRVCSATDDGGLDGLDPHQSWALIVIASRPRTLRADDLAVLLGVTRSGATTRLVRPLVDRGFVVESSDGTLAPSEFGAAVAGPALDDADVQHDVDVAVAELAWFRSES